jgi:hypothetical protein
MAEPEKPKAGDQLVAAYERMLARAHEAFQYAEEETLPRLRHILDEVRDKTVELGELTREEAEKVAIYLERDIQDAAGFMARTGEDLRAWWRFDLDLVEERLLDAFSGVADQTRLQWQRLADDAWVASHYRSGEICGPGTLVCAACGEELHLHKPGRIPPCPKCRATLFERAVGKGDGPPKEV